VSTLRGRLLSGTTLAVAVVLLLAGVALYGLVERALVREIDRSLAAKARVIASTVSQSGRKLDLEFVELDTKELFDPERGEFLEVWFGDFLVYPVAPEAELTPPEPTSAELSSDWIDLATGVRGRAVTLHFQPELEEPDDDEDELDEELAAEVEADELVLVLAGDAGAADRLLATLRALLGGVGVATLVTAGAVLLLVVRRSLRPLAALSERVAGIGEESLATRLDATGVPGELLPVVQRVNGLLERLEAAFERERAFSNDVAHELRTPLAGLRATLEVTAKRQRSEEEYTAALRDAAAIAGQLQAMVERLLQLARLDAGRVAVDSESYVLSDAAVEAWEPFTAQAVERGLRVDLDLQAGAQVSADRELVEVILRNLYENAVTYADAGGEIRISTRSLNGDAVTLEVANSGSRLSQSQAADATQRFWRGDSARTEAGLHCGLGLSLVEKATGALAGELELRSRADGEFAVEVTLPH